MRTVGAKNKNKRKKIDRSNPEKDKKEFIEELINQHGNLYVVYTGLPNWSYNRYLEETKNDPEFVEAIKNVQQDTRRWVENKMFEAIAKGDKDMTRFYLRTKCDYSETQKIEANVKAAVDVEAEIAEMKKLLSE